MSKVNKLRNGQKVFCLIPARGGSVSIPRKNLAVVGGAPLVGRSILYAKSVDTIHDVWVSTDDLEIGSISSDYGASVIQRPKAISGGDATSESALLHALEKWEFDGSLPQVIVFMQATSPVIDVEALRIAIDIVVRGEADVAFSTVISHSFMWRWNGPNLVGINHDHRNRLRRQDRDVEYRETGAFYVMNVDGFLKAKHRFFGRIVPVETNLRSSFEIDEPEDFEVFKRLAERVRSIPDVPIRALVTDFDGVHTDDRAIVDQDGREAVSVSRADGLGVSRLRSEGINFLILSRETNAVVVARATKLGVPCIAGSEDKKERLLDWLAEQGISPSECAYVGNELNDLECLEAVGFAMAPANTLQEVRAKATVLLEGVPGRNLVREACEVIIDHNRQFNNEKRADAGSNR